MADGSAPSESPPPSSSSGRLQPVVELVSSTVLTGAVVTLALTGHITGTEALIALGLTAAPLNPVGAVRRLLTR